MVSVTIQSRPSLSLFVSPSSLIAVLALLASLILAACVGPQLPPQPSRQAEESSGQPAPSIQQAGEAGEAPAPPSEERRLAIVPPLPLAVPDVRQPARSAEREEAAPVIEAKPVFVTAQRESYAVERAATATKTDQPIMETPVSIQVVPRAVMDDQQVISVGDALKNVSGVQPGGYTFYDNFILRGFEANASTYRNGLRHQATTALETANLDVIEVLKGPASVLYGRAEPGGLVNLATKRPLDVPYYSLQQQFGSYN
ncbi:MAG TPA: hypothetical protein DCQ94_01870, partial [Nitrospira sp.]|nr:hypothetical protein [Nitrospira sp.]